MSILHLLMWVLIIAMWVTFILYVAWSVLRRSGR